MKTLLKEIISAAAAVVLLAGGVFALSGKQIIKKSEQAVRGDTQISLVDVIIKTRRWTRTLRVKTWDNRLEKKTFVEILSPPKDAGNRFLMISKEGLMWQYNPDIGREIKIFPSMMLQSWMGSDFTNDDMVKESSMVDDYNQTLLEKKDVDGQECYVVMMIPKPEAAVVWGKVLYYSRVKDYLPVKEEFFDQHGNLKKVLTCGNFREMGGRVIPTLYRMVTIKRREQERSRDEYTLMEIRDIVFNVRIGERIFTLQNLRRR